ncbi:MAG: BrnT family toxin [Candidatus Omnitrophica bacterium]|nr:BrnT family toxin [Candidatus Omnitrophota bacterium]
MSKLRFEWDERKDKINQAKHGVSFEEAQTVFYDDNAIEFYDNTHSSKENRLLLLGLSYKLRALLVCHCYRKSASMIRIISARKATKREEKEYIGGLS